MKLTVQPKYISIALHALIWSVLLLLPYFVSGPENNFRIGIIPGVFFTLAGLVHMGVFYGNAFFLYPRLYNRRYWWLYILASIALIMAASGLKGLMVKAWFPGVLENHMAGRFVFGSTMPFYLISIIYRRIIDKMRHERELRERQATQLLTELKFLRSQISPHFLFNVLTNMVSLARKKSDQLEPALITLADLMRYMLYDTQGKKVPLQKEIAYLNSYIALQKLRFGSDVDVALHIAADTDNLLIEPMLLIPFVENAFKHGTGQQGPNTMNVALAVNNGVMTYEVSNPYTDEPDASKDDSSGIGLANVQTRLELLYKHKYTLNVRKDNNLFHITLTLKLA
ncbi:sensor histidine kinase [Chitinophaga alhagiae]|uniref:sensor histidine kinase n=1 Tax=Chitinophaga alhagiae TaxID=2203219 RepID=UPI000E5C0826|nr:histidine kinase [Chitinophaga alhagiae]